MKIVEYFSRLGVITVDALAGSQPQKTIFTLADGPHIVVGQELRFVVAPGQITHLFTVQIEAVQAPAPGAYPENAIFVFKYGFYAVGIGADRGLAVAG